MDIDKLELTPLEQRAYKEYNTLGSNYNRIKSAALFYTDFYNYNQEKYLRKSSGMSNAKWASTAKVTVPKCQVIINRIKDWLLENYTLEVSNYPVLSQDFLEQLIVYTLVQGTQYVRVDINEIGQANFFLYPLDTGLYLMDTNNDPEMFYAQYTLSDGTTNIEIITWDYIKIIKYQGEKILAEEVYNNPYQMPNVIPIYWNKRPREQYGTSYLQGIAELNRELDELYSGKQRILQYHSAPMLVIKGAAKSNISLAVNRVIYLPENAKASYLTWNQDVKAFDSQIQDITNLISEKSGIPEQILTTDLPSGLSSLSLEVLYSPVRTLIDRMAGYFEQQVIKIYDFAKELNPNHAEPMVNVKFNRDIVPKADING